MNAVRRNVVAVSIIAVLVCLFGCGEGGKELKRPYEVSGAIFDSVMTLIKQGEVSSREQFIRARNMIAALMIDEVDTDSLARADSLLYGRLLSWSGRHGKARGIFEDLCAGVDDESRGALRELINMEIEEDNGSRAEELLKKFRGKFPPTPEYSEALYEQCEHLGGRYNDMNRLEDAIRVYRDELNSLPFDAPYQSFTLLSELTGVCQEAGRIDECRAILERVKTGLERGLEDYADRVVYADSLEEAEDHIPGDFKRYMRSCDLLIARMDLIGKPAPALSFRHVYNADSSMTLDSLKGKVVALDFWATWCVPCIISFSEMKELYAEFKERGFEIVGVTSLQAFYTDVETGHTDENVGPQREIELTATYLQKRGATWPCGISTSSVFSPDYTVDVIPTLVAIDRRGNVRFIQSSAGQINQKRRVIEKLLREEALEAVAP